MKTFEEHKRDAAAIGIIPGADVKWDGSWGANCRFIVPPYEKWYNVGNGNYAWRTEAGAPGGYCWIYGGENSYYTPTVITPAPSENQKLGLVKGLACKPDPHMRQAIVEKAKELGLWNLDHSWPWLVYDPDHPSTPIPGNTTLDNNQTIISPGEFYDRLIMTPKPEPSIYIDGYLVNFNSGSIKVGCTTVPNDIVRKVVERLKD